MSSGSGRVILMDILRWVVKRRRRGGKALEGEEEEGGVFLTFASSFLNSYYLSLPHYIYMMVPAPSFFVTPPMRNLIHNNKCITIFHL